jgi:ABC-type lipoprotein release transport system permease subunit
MERMNKPNNVYLLSTLRQPIRTLFFVLLLCLISFAFIGKAAEYLVVQRETERLGSYYRSIGSLQKIDNAEDWDVTEGAEIVKASPYLAYEDRRRVSSAVMDGTYNGDVAGNPFTSGPYKDLFESILNHNFWFYGVLDSKLQILRSEGVNAGTFGYALTFDVDRVVTGYPEHIQEGQPLTLLFVFRDREEAIPAIKSLKEGQRYFIRGWFDSNFTPNPNWENADSKLQIRALDDAQTWYLPVAENAEIDFIDPALRDILNPFEIAAQNQRALSVVTSADMSAMPDTQQASRKYYLLEGRWINREDDLQARNVIVIRADFAQRRGLKIGDSIALTFRGLQQSSIGGYIMSEADRENWRSYPTHQERFEIVGLFLSSVGIDPNMVFIPNSTLPIGFERQDDSLYYTLYSFVLNSPQEQDAFVHENQDRLAELGIGLTFVDNNGRNFWSSVDPLRRSASASVVIYGLVLLTALGLAVFLYLVQRRRDYAILRALGVPKREVNQQMLIPIVVIGALGILTGGIVSWRFALGQAATSLASLPTPEGELLSTELHPGYLAALCTGILFLLLAFAKAGIGRYSRAPVLELLQGGSGRANRKQKPIQPAFHESKDAPALPPTRSVRESALGHISAPVENVSLPTRLNPAALIRFGLRQMIRSRLKSLLTIAVAFGFVFALGWIQWTMDRNRAEVERLYNTTVVEADIMPRDAGLFSSGGSAIIAKETIEQVLRSGFVKSAYLEAGANRVKLSRIGGATEMQEVSLQIRGLNQPQTFFSATLGGALVKYAPGWDVGLFTEPWTLEDIEKQFVPAVFPEALFHQFGLTMGDTLIMENEREQSFRYIVAGTYSGGSIGFENPPILLPLSAMAAMEGEELRYGTAQFQLDPAKNRDLQAFRTRTEFILSNRDAGLLPLRVVIWDEELRRVIEPLEKNLSLLTVLYPITVAISALIGMGLSLLLLLQAAKEAAILRVLGVTKSGARVVLSGEYLLLSLAGVALSIIVLFFLGNNASPVLHSPVLFASGLYLLGALVGSVMGAVSITNRKPLALLQVKE